MPPQLHSMLRVAMLAVVVSVSVAIEAEAAPARETAIQREVIRRPRPVADAAEFDHLGAVVAIAGDLLAASAPDDDIGTGHTQGSVYAYRRENGQWHAEQKLVGSLLTYERFGSALALDSHALFVGAPGRVLSDGANVSAVHRWRRQANGWSPAEVIPAPAGVVSFGRALAFNGRLLAVGASILAGGDDVRTGTVFLYDCAASCSLVTQILPQSITDDPSFGATLHHFGERLLVGAVKRVGFGGDDTAGSVYVFENLDGAWNETARLQSPLSVSGNGFGLGLASIGDELLVGAPREAGPAGAVYRFRLSGDDWIASGMLARPPGSVLNGWGQQLAIDGNVLAVSAGKDTAQSIGRVFLFDRSGTTWTLRPDPVTAGAATTESFGEALSFTGGSLVAGSPEDFIGYLHAGSVYVFSVDEAGHALQQRISRARGLSYERLGASIALDGDFLAAVAPGQYTSSSVRGGVSIFTRSPTGWTETARMACTDSGDAANFGRSLAFAPDELLLGSPGFGSTAVRGRVHRYGFDGSQWLALETLAPAVSYGGSRFGSAVARRGDTLFVGADDASTTDMTSRGATFVLRRSGTDWLADGELSYPEAAAFDHFGFAIATDGDWLAVGAPGASHAGVATGVVIVYKRDGDSWQWHSRLVPDQSIYGAYFGSSISVRGDLMLIGAYRDGTSNDDRTGSAYVFRMASGAWESLARVRPAGLNNDDRFGDSLGIHGDLLLFGAPRQATPGDTNGGRVHAYRVEGTTLVYVGELDRSGSPHESGFGDALVSDDQRLAVGAPDVAGDAPMGDASEGAVFIYPNVEPLLFSDGFE